MASPVLHYIYSPLCGWCYGAAPLVKVARAQLPVMAHAGGMMAGANSQFVSKQLRDYVLEHDRRIAKLTGQVFGDAYINGLLQDSTTLLDAQPPIAAILAAEEVSHSGLDMLASIQTAHYRDGLKISDRKVLLSLGRKQGLDIERFAATFDAVSGNFVQQHIRETGRLMADCGVTGFPGFVLESGNVRILLNISDYFGKPEAFAEQLRNAISGNSTAAQPSVFSCGPDNCAI